MEEPEKVCKIALSFLRGVNRDMILRMEECGVTPQEFFSLETSELSNTLRLAKGVQFPQIEREEAIFKARREAEQTERHHINVKFLLDSDYPTRLYQTDNSPIVVYQLGKTELDSPHVINIVGTRKPTAYGLAFCESLVSDMAAYFPDLVVVSGLAYGIDAGAHRAALNANVATVGVVAHGLNMIYPAQHRDLAREIISKGGSVLTEYPFGETPYRQRFLERNRIIAGLADVTIVVESDIKGGALSTANSAFHYSRDVAALPGRISDKLSSGCNKLIRQNKASLITGAPDLIELLGWQPMGLNIDTRQRNLFPEMEGEAKIVYDAIRYTPDPIQADRIHHQTLIPMPKLMSILGELEFDGIIIRHPGNRFSIA